MIKESLEGKKIAITGATGFLGTALVELLLREVKDVQLRLLIRPAGRRSAQKRLERDIFRNDAFKTLKDNLGESTFEAMVKSQIEAISADISKPAGIPCIIPIKALPCDSPAVKNLILDNIIYSF